MSLIRNKLFCRLESQSIWVILILALMGNDNNYKTTESFHHLLESRSNAQLPCDTNSQSGEI